MNYLYYDSALVYPSAKWSFSPSERYPEYPFGEDAIAGEHNGVYEAIRAMMHGMHLDDEHYGKAEWNPLGEWVKSGMNVLLKPNFVLDVRGEDAIGDKEDLSSLVTHASVIRCVLDYVYIALCGGGEVSGKMTVGDAPIQLCDFGALMRRGNYECVSAFYKERAGIDVPFADFRGYREAGNNEGAGNAVKVEVGELSYFYHSGQNAAKYRVPNYSNKVVKSYHHGKKQEYVINSIALDADVIINLPKPKTHRKNGYTAALKNFVGTSYIKECLPHHREGSSVHGGDEYKNSSITRRLMSKLRAIRTDRALVLFREKKERNKDIRYKAFSKVYGKLKAADKKDIAKHKYEHGDAVLDGAWYGNDTLWRAVLDLNRIMLYASKAGKLMDKRQRAIVHLGDMVVAGEREGPLSPSAKDAHILLFADNAVDFDCTVVKIMGFDYHKFKGLCKALECAVLAPTAYDSVKLDSNVPSCSGTLGVADIASITTPFVPANGWVGHVEE